MSDNTGIEWSDATWNPIVGCSVVSPGCTNCYAMREAGGRLAATPKFTGLTQSSKAGPVWNGQVRLWEKALDQPLRWKKPRRIFVNSMSDLFHENLPGAAIDQVFAVMALCPQHVFIVLTKRASRMRDYMQPFDRRRADSLGEQVLALGYSEPLELLRWPLPNVWLGVSAEDQARADERREDLRNTPAAVQFVSYEPALGPVDWRGWEFLSWLISGGESGPNARPSHPDWHRGARDFCQANNIAYFFKQWGEWIAADEWYDKIQAGPAQIIVSPDRALPWLPPRPLSYGDAERLAKITGGHKGQIEHHSDGTTLIRVGKRAAGRLLDGRTWDEFPEMANAMSEWRPIETAPKDGFGHRVLLWSWEYEIYGICYFGVDPQDGNSAESWRMAWDYQLFPEPSHWMPLPEPPK